MIAIQLNLSPKPISAEKFDSIAKILVGRYQYPDSKELEITYENNKFYAKSGDKTKQRITPRENNAFSYECTENYYQLRNNNKKLELIPVSLYRAEQPALIKL